MKPTQRTVTSAIAWSGVALLALAAFLYLPRPTRAGGRALDVVLVDVSASAVAVRPSWRAQVREALARAAADARARDHELAIAAFGADLRRVFGPAPASDFEAALASNAFEPFRTLLGADRVHGENATRLAAALVFADSVAGDRTLARVLVVGDGQSTDGDPAPRARALLDRGAQIDFTPLAPPELDDAGIAPLVVPPRVRAGTPVALDATVWFRPGRARAVRSLALEIVRRGPDGTSAITRAIDLSATFALGVRTELRARVDLPALVEGRHEIEASVHALDAGGAEIPDPTPEDSGARATIVAAGALAIGVAGEPDARAAFSSALEPVPAGLTLTPLEMREIAAENAVFDVIVTLDAAPDEKACAALTAFVRSGGGWLDVADRAWSAALPCDAAALVPAGSELSPRDVVFLVDASGSMAGEPFAAVRSALAQILPHAAARDHVSVRFFAADLEPPLDLGPAGPGADPAARRAALERLSAARAPSGSTHLWSALEKLALGLKSSQETLIVLLSDGRDPDRNAEVERGRSVRAQLSARGGRLSLVAAGEDPDRELLQSLCAPDETLMEAGTLATPGADALLARLFERELARGALREGRDLAVLAPAGIDLSALVRAGIPANSTHERLPSIARFVLARAANAAVVAWTSDAGEPLLALRRTGLGVCASLAFLPGGDGAPSWRGRADLVAPLVRALAPPARTSARSPRVVARAQDLVLVDVPLDAPAIVRGRVESADDHAGVALEFVAGRAGTDPIAERACALPFDLALPADAVVVLDLGRGSSARVALPALRAPEFRGTEAGFTIPLAGRPLEDHAGSPRAHPAAAWVLGLGLAALFVSAFLGHFSARRR